MKIHWRYQNYILTQHPSHKTVQIYERYKGPPPPGLYLSKNTSWDLIVVGLSRYPIKLQVILLKLGYKQL